MVVVAEMSLRLLTGLRVEPFFRGKTPRRERRENFFLRFSGFLAGKGGGGGGGGGEGVFIISFLRVYTR